MAFEIPSLPDVIERTRQSFKSELPGSNPWAFPSNVYTSAKVIAARIWESLLRLQWVFLQAFVLTAEGVYLERHGQQYGIARKASTKSAGSVLIASGTDGAVIPAGTLFQREDGTQFESVASEIIGSDGTLTIEIIATTVGAGGNTEGGSEMSMLATISGAPSTVNVSSAGLGGGAPVETDEQLRERILQRLQYPPHAGAKSDYIRWALAAAGVTRVWVVGNGYGPGTVLVYFVMDDSYEDGIPLQADVDRVQILLEELAPVTATVIVEAPIAVPMVIDVSNLTPYNPTTVAASLAEIEDVIKERAEVSTTAKPFAFRRSWIWQAVSNSSGEEYHTVIQPRADMQFKAGYLPVFDTNYVRVTD